MFTLRSLLILLGLVVTASAVAQTRVTVDPDSRLWIEGSSTVNKFTCDAGRIDGEAILDRGRSEAEVVIPVDTFDCGKSRMNKDFYKALKGDAYPRIHFELTDAAVGSAHGSGFDVTVSGRLTISGVTRNISLVSQGRKQSDGQFRVVGKLPLSMRDFNIEPPTAFAGLIRAHDRIVVAFDLVATLDGATTAEVCGQDGDILC